MTRITRITLLGALTMVGALFGCAAASSDVDSQTTASALALSIDQSSQKASAAGASSSPATANRDTRRARADDANHERAGLRARASRDRDGQSGSDDSESEDPTVALQGTWRLATDNAEAKIDRAIARVTDQMNIFVREIAKGRIDGAINPERQIRINPNGEVVQLSLDDWTVSLPLNGPRRSVNASDGTPLRVRARVQRERLVIDQAAEDGGRYTYFTRDGDYLTMTARVHSPQLPDDIVYRLRYRRVGS